MSIDYAFVEKMLYKHSQHLESVKNSLETYIENHQRQIVSLEKLDQKKYGSYLKELRFKLAEALEKLSHVEPNLNKLSEQLAIIAAIVVAEEKKS
jgi:hypothetical protein